MKGVRFFILSLFCISFLSCKYDLVQPPTTEPDVVLNASDYANEISIPTGLTATQGGCKKVTLTWDILPNAIQYQIFSAETPFDTFIQVGETPDNSNEIEISEKPGETKYYAIKAVNYFGKVSGLSKFVMGSTIANPVITSIESGNNGTTSTVNWWMENCNTKTYQNSISYIITCFEDDRSTVKDTKTAQKGSTSVTFDNLKPHTNYFYQVEAFLSSAQDEVEKSDMLDAETARRLIPRAPVNFEAEKGLSSDKIILAWKLPEFVDISLGTNSFEQHPIYFTIERKLSSEDDTKFKKVVAYLGTIQNDDDSTTDTKIKFSCEDSTSSSTNLSLNTAESEDPTTQYPDYKPGTIITWSDTTAKPGLKYTYRIRSYTDDVTKTISSDESVSTSEGWIIGNISFFATARYTDDPNDETKIKSAKINFDMNFETNGIEYKYYIVEQRTAYESGSAPDTPVILQTCNSIEQVKAFSKTFTSFTEEIKGEYNYSLIITKASAASSTEAITTIKCLGTIRINDIKEKCITLFTVDDGYKDKFILNWDYQEDYSYEYKFIPKGENGTNISPVKLTNFQHNDTIASYTVSAEPGTVGQFILYMYSNEGNQVDNKSLTDEYSTLGTASPKITSYDYDKITVSWDQVQHTSGDIDDYSIEAVLDGETGNFATLENTKIEKDETENTFTCTITNPKGFNDYKVSGKPITLKVKSQSSNQADTTEASITVRTLGPALLNTKISSSDANNICVTWNEVEGASSYIIYRTKYSYDDYNTIERTDKYYYSKTDSTLSVNSDDTDDRASVAYNTGSKCFTLTDTYKADDSDGTNSYKSNQAELSWGIPYGYVVIPVLSENDFTFNTNSISLDKASKVQYNSITEVKGATYGYARKLIAEKAANGTIQKLTWEKPYNSSRTPYVFRRENGTNGNWEYVSNANTEKSSTSISFTMQKEEDLTKAFDYIIGYNTNSPASIPPSLVTKLSEKKSSGNTEPDNKGYLLNIGFTVTPGFVAGSTDASTYYRIKLSWQNWDYSKRAIGPSSANIQILNKNFADGWKTVYSLNNECKPVAQGSLSETTITSSDNQIYLSPVFNSYNLANGQLKVTRDVKQYFNITLQSPNGTAELGKDESIYTYRQITEEELCRCVGLIIADTLYQTGIPYKTVSGSKSRSLQGNSGSFSIKGSPKGAFDYKNYVSWEFSSNYKHIFKNGISSKYPENTPKTFVSSFILDSSGRSCAHELGISGDVTPTGNTLYHLPELDITIFNAECDLTTYNGTYKFSIGAPGDSTSWDLTFGNNITVTGDSTKVQALFPYKIGEEHEDGDSSVNSNFLVYKSPFWN